MIEHYSPKVAQIFQSATQQAKTSWHLARQKMTFSLIFSMIETRSVQFPELATKINAAAKDDRAAGAVKLATNPSFLRPLST